MGAEVHPLVFFSCMFWYEWFSYMIDHSLVLSTVQEIGSIHHEKEGRVVYDTMVPKALINLVRWKRLDPTVQDFSDLS